MADTAIDVSLEAFRAEARAWLEKNFPASLKDKANLAMEVLEGGKLQGDAEDWRKKLGAKGWGTPTWPKEYGGGGLTQTEARVLQEEMTKAGAWNPIPMVTGLGVTMVGPTILDYGTDYQKETHLPPISRGEVRWCLGYSEPGAGSDLAALTTKAEDAGDHWVINGQKIWTSGAHHAQWCGMLVRTDPHAKKHDGITFLLVDMNQPGKIDPRPIELIAGSSVFCEVFFTDARGEKYNQLGELNNGWTVGKRLLQHERASQTGGAPGGPRASGPSEKFQDFAKRYVGVDAQGRLADSDLRARIVNNLIETKAHALTLERVVEEARGNMQVSNASSILKNAASWNAQARAELTIEIMGNRGLGWEGEGFTEDEIAAGRAWLAGKAMTIYGGSQEVQNNIISKRILGLPDMTKST